MTIKVIYIVNCKGRLPYVQYFYIVFSLLFIREYLVVITDINTVYFKNQTLGF